MRNPWLKTVVASAIGFVLTELCVVMAIIGGGWFAIAMCMVDASFVSIVLGYCIGEYLRWRRAKAQYDKWAQIAEESEKEQAK